MNRSRSNIDQKKLKPTQAKKLLTLALDRRRKPEDREWALRQLADSSTNLTATYRLPMVG